MRHWEGHLTRPGVRSHGRMVRSGFARVGNIRSRNVVAFVRQGRLWWQTSVL
jgi:hypothetical protein